MFFVSPTVYLSLYVCHVSLYVFLYAGEVDSKVMLMHLQPSVLRIRSIQRGKQM